MAGEIELLPTRTLTGIVGFDAAGLAGYASPLALATAAQIARNDWQLATLGDSRVAMQFNDSLYRSKSGYSALNFVNSRNQQLFSTVYYGGWSGDRTDQINVRLPNAIASTAKVLYYLGGVNDIAQQYPSASISGYISAANKIYACNTAIAAGMTVILETEVGAENFTTAQIEQMHVHNAIIRNYVQATTGVYLHDSTFALADNTVGTGVVRFKPGYFQEALGSGVHAAALGAYHWSKSLENVFKAVFKPGYSDRPHASFIPAYGRWGLSPNPCFYGTAGTNGTGNTGTVPTGCTAANSGSTSTTSIGTLNGQNYVDVTITFTAASQRFTLYSESANQNWAAGDTIYGYAKAELLSGTVAECVCLYMENNFDGSTKLFTDGLSMLNKTGPNEAFSVDLRTIDWLIPALTTKGWLAPSVRVYSTGAGTVNVRIWYMGVARRPPV